MSGLLDRIAVTIDAVGRGDFEARVVPIGPGQGVEERVAHGLNRILDLVDATLKEARAATVAAAAGEYGRKPIVAGIPGDAARMLMAVGDTVQALERQARDLEVQTERQRGASRAFHEHVGRLLGEVAESAARLVGSTGALDADLRGAATVIAELTSDVQDVDEHLGSVASTTSELHASATSIGAQAAQADRLSRRSRDEGRAALDTMHELEGSFTQVSRSATFIDGIAHQTRMLALNATIEASRAGSAGAGFAVVAGEVKQLAHETRSAMHEIASHLDQMGKATTRSAGGLDGIVAALAQIGDATAGVATSVNEQQAAVADLDRRTSAVRQASLRVASRSTELDASMQRTRSAMNEVARVARGLLEEAHRLEDASESFARELDLGAGEGR